MNAALVYKLVEKGRPTSYLIPQSAIPPLIYSNSVIR